MTIWGSSFKKKDFNSPHNIPESPVLLGPRLSHCKPKYLSFTFWRDSVPDDATTPECRPCLRAGYFVQPRRPHLLFLRAGRVGFSRLSQWLTWQKKANSSFGSTLEISVTWDHPKDQSECIIGHLTFCNITVLSQALSEKDEEIKLKVEGH